MQLSEFCFQSHWHFTIFITSICMKCQFSINTFYSETLDSRIVLRAERKDWITYINRELWWHDPQVHPSLSLKSSLPNTLDEPLKRPCLHIGNISLFPFSYWGLVYPGKAKHFPNFGDSWLDSLILWVTKTFLGLAYNLKLPSGDKAL